MHTSNRYESQVVSIPIAEQRNAWEKWNTDAREHKLSPISARQAQVVEARVAQLGRKDLSVIDVGCGTGWMCDRLSQFGKVTGTDLTESVLQRARLRFPEVNFVSGDFFELDLPPASFDVAVCLEVLSHVPDQGAFIRRLASLIKPGGQLILTTQNRPVLQRWSEVGAPIAGTLRQWVNAKELRALLAPHFESVQVRSIFPVGDRGWLRVVNSHKLNKALSSMISARALERAKEAAMLGHTLVAFAAKPSTR